MIQIMILQGVPLTGHFPPHNTGVKTPPNKKSAFPNPVVVVVVVIVVVVTE